jgi:hypothetical protein
MLASQIVNIVVVGGMVVGLLLIFGVVSALLAPRPTVRVPQAAGDPAVTDLDDRLRKLTSASPFAEDLGVRPRSAIDEEQGGPRTPGLIRPVIEVQPPRPVEARPTNRPISSGAPASDPSFPLSERLGVGESAGSKGGPRPALPGDILGGLVNAPPTVSPRSQALDPLAARFSGSQRLSEVPLVAPPVTDFGSAAKRPELPGAVVGDLPTMDRGFSGPEVRTPAGERTGFSGGVVDAQSSGLERRSGFAGPTPDPFSSRTGDVAVPAVGRRNELPGTVADQIPPALDIRAILRGEAVPRGALPPSTSFGSDPTVSTFKPGLSTGPLPPIAISGPVGGVRFDPGLLELRPLKPDPEVGSSRLTIPGPPAKQWAGLAEMSSAPSEIEFDAGKLMDDFDLPDAGFETHVFSTAELVDDEAIPHPPLGRMTQFGSDAPQSPFSIPITEYQTDRDYSRESRSDSASFGDYLDSGEQELGTMPLADLLYLTSEQEVRARRQLEEVSLIADVIFVKLMAGDGSVMLEAGMESGDSRTNQHLAGLIAVADLETDRRALGSVSGITLESPEGVLVLSPLHGGAVLATLLGNPVRLGTLRRQLKKPVGSLRSLLMESSV